MSERTSAGAATWLAPTTVVLLLLALAFFALLKTFSFRFVSGDEHVYNYMSLMVLEGQWPLPGLLLPPSTPADLPHRVPVRRDRLLDRRVQMRPDRRRHVQRGPPLSDRTSHARATRRSSRRDSVPLHLRRDPRLEPSHERQRRRRLHLGGGPTRCFAAGPSPAASCSRALRSRGVYAVPMMLMLATLLCLRSLREAGRFALGWSALMGLAIALFAVVAGGAFWENNVGYHLSKVPMRHSWYDKFENVFFLNFHLMAGFCAGHRLDPLSPGRRCRWAVCRRDRAAAAALGETDRRTFRSLGHGKPLRCLPLHHLCAGIPVLLLEPEGLLLVLLHVGDAVDGPTHGFPRRRRSPRDLEPPAIHWQRRRPVAAGSRGRSFAEWQSAGSPPQSAGVAAARPRGGKAPAKDGGREERRSPRAVVLAGDSHRGGAAADVRLPRTHRRPARSPGVQSGAQLPFSSRARFSATA